MATAAKPPPIDQETAGSGSDGESSRRFWDVRRFLPGTAFGKNAVLLAGATALGQAIIVLSSPLLTRLYTPVEFGVLAVFVSIVSSLSPLGSLNYQLAIPLPEEDDAAANLLALSMGVLVLFSAAVAGVAFVSGEQVAGWLNTPSLGRYLWLLPLSLAGASAYRALSFWAVRKGDYRRIARTRITQSAAQVISQVGFGLGGVGTIGLLVGDAIGRTGGSGTLVLSAIRRDGGTLRRVSRRGISAVAARFKRFPLLSSWSVLLNNAGQNLPTIFIAAFFGPLEAGFFALGQRVIAMPMRTIGQSVAQVYIGKASELARHDARRLHLLFLRTTRKLLWTGAIPIAAIALTAHIAFPVVFGDQWREAGVYVQYLAISYVLQFVAVPVSQTLNVIERQDLQLWWDIVRLLLVVGSFLAGAYLGLSVQITIFGYGIAMAAAYTVLLALINGALKSNGRVAR